MMFNLTQNRLHKEKKYKTETDLTRRLSISVNVVVKIYARFSKGTGFIEVTGGLDLIRASFQRKGKGVVNYKYSL